LAKQIAMSYKSQRRFFVKSVTVTHFTGSDAIHQLWNSIKY